LQRIFLLLQMEFEQQRTAARQIQRTSVRLPHLVRYDAGAVESAL
jgi:hypothetical protein